MPLLEHGSLRYLQRRPTIVFTLFTGRASNDSFPFLIRAQVSHLVIGSPQLETEDRLEVFSFQKHIAFQSVAQIDGMS